MKRSDFTFINEVEPGTSSGDGMTVGSQNAGTSSEGESNEYLRDSTGGLNKVAVKSRASEKGKKQTSPSAPTFTIVDIDLDRRRPTKLEPITHVNFEGNNEQTKVSPNARMESIDNQASAHEIEMDDLIKGHSERRSASVWEKGSEPNANARHRHHLSLSFPHLSIDGAAFQSAIEMRLKSWLKPMDNKMNMKVFGSKRAMKDEQLRYSRAGWVIHPTSIFRLYWDMWVLLLLLINLFALPVLISFFADNVSARWIAFNAVSDTAFLLDILLNFRTGVLVHGSPNKFILDPKIIAKRYLKTWFFIDLISSLPIDYIVEAATQSSTKSLIGATRTLKLLRFAKLLGLLKLLRLSRLVRYVQQYEEILNVTRSVIRFINLVSIILLIAHWNGCLQFLVPYLQDFPETSWVSIHNLMDNDWWEQYCWSLFKAMSHMLCIGYGRYPPQNIAEVWVTTFSMLTGATFYAMFIAYCINFIQQLDSPGRNYREKIQQIEEYMSYRRLPVELRDRMTKYYDHRYQGRMFDEEKILHEISKPLREQIINYNCRDLVQSVPFFTEAEPDFVSAIITRLSFEVYLEGDIIVREGELGTEMYFLREGVVSVTVGGKHANELCDGAYFGEICLLTNARRTASVTAKTVCDVFILNAEHFRDVVDEFPTMRILMEIVAEDRLNKMGKPVQLSTLNANSGQVRFASSTENFPTASLGASTSTARRASLDDARYRRPSNV